VVFVILVDATGHSLLLLNLKTAADPLHFTLSGMNTMHESTAFRSARCVFV